MFFRCWIKNGCWHLEITYNKGVPLGACSPIRMMSINSSTTKSAFSLFFILFFALLPISIVPSLLIPLCPRMNSYLTWNSPEREFFERREPRVVMVAGSSSRQARRPAGRHKKSSHFVVSPTTIGIPSSDFPYRWIARVFSFSGRVGSCYWIRSASVVEKKRSFSHPRGIWEEYDWMKKIETILFIHN